MPDQKKPSEPSTQAENNSIAIGSIEVGGDVTGTITIGNTGYTADQVSVLITQIQSTFQPKPFDGRCPYKGLDVFEEEDAELFFGREKLVDDLVSRVKDSRTVFVTGPSGSGKSSLVRAGVIHALKQGSIKGSDRWLYATMKPGRDPIGELGRIASSLAGSTNSEDEIRAKAMADITIFARWCEIALKDGHDKRVVLFIDQFEEVFTQISKETERVAFLNLLTHAATVNNGRVIMLFSMRSDFVSNCATYPKLNALLNQQFIQIAAMQPEELVSAIAQPALRVGLRIDPDLIAQIINEMKGEPGALPLMQFALKDLFDSQQEKSGVIALTLTEYLQRGGIHKALERHADDSFSKLSNHEQELARSIFSGLIEIGRGTQDTKRTAIFDELIPSSAKSEEVKAIVQKLADARLITTDEQAGKDTVTISHEKLIDAWPWLKKLVNENRVVIALQNEIASDAKEWEELKRDPSYLYTGGRLANVREQLSTNKLILSDTANQFIQSGYKKQRQGQVARVFSIAAVIAMVIIGTLVFSYQSTINSKKLAEQSNLFANTQQAIASTSQANAKKAEDQAKIALARQLVAQAQSINTNSSSKQMIATLLALQSMHIYPVFEATQILQNNSLAKPIASMTHDGVVFSVAFSPDSKFVVSGGCDRMDSPSMVCTQGSARVWEAATGKETTLMTHDNAVWSAVFSPNGKYVVSGSLDKTARVWDTVTGEETARMTHGYTVRSVAFSPNAKFVVSGGCDQMDSPSMVCTQGSARVWEAATGKETTRMTHDGAVSSVAFSTDGKYVV
jgi:energy-coupling factor transporter ATP-binding protein EcfA2